MIAWVPYRYPMGSQEGLVEYTLLNSEPRAVPNRREQTADTSSRMIGTTPLEKIGKLGTTWRVANGTPVWEGAKRIAPCERAVQNLPENDRARST